MIIVLFGPPGSGKGTQAQYLVEQKGFTYVPTGELIRKEIEQGGEFANTLSQIIQSGQLVGDEYVLALVEKKVSANKEKHLLFDGFPRTLKQAVAFNSMLSNFGLLVDAFIFFDIGFDALSQRIVGRFSCATCGALYHETNHPTKIPGQCDQCGSHVFQKRSDDTYDVFEKRYQVYLSEANKLKDYYQSQGCLTVVDAAQDMIVVRKQVEEAINKQIN